MNSFPIQNPTKVVKPITTNSLLMSTSKYSKEATQPAEDNKLTHAISQENFGARRLIIKSEASKRLSQNSKEVESSITEQVPPIENKQKEFESSKSKMTVQTFVNTVITQGQNLNSKNFSQVNPNNNKMISQSIDIKQELKATIDHTLNLNAAKDQRSLGNRTPQPIRYGTLQNENSLNQRQLNQTPQPSRYGAERRMQTQQARQSDLESNFFKQKIRIETETEKFQGETETKPFEKVSTVVQKFKRGNSSNSVEYGGIESQEPHLVQELNQINDEMSQNQIKGTLSKNIGRKELLVKQFELNNIETIFETIMENEEIKIVKKGKPHFILFVLKSLFFEKVKQAFNKLMENKKSKSMIVCKILANKMNSVSNRINFDLCFLALNKLMKDFVSPPIIKRSLGVERLLLNSCRIIFNLLNRIGNRNLKEFFINKNTLSIHSINRNKIYSVLNSIFKRRCYEGFRKFAEKTSSYFAIQNYYLHQANKISKSYNLKIQQSCLKKLKLFIKNGGEMMEGKSTPKKNTKFEFECVSRETQDKGMIEKMEKEMWNKNKTVLDLLRVFESEKIELENKIKFLRNETEEFEMERENKLKQSLELKEKLSSFEATEENHPQNQDLLIETKFPILYELFRKVEKSNRPDIVIDDLTRTLTIFQDEMKNDELVKEWLVLEENSWIKNKISRYEGYPEYERKAGKRVEDEGALLIEMIKSYTKEKYTWEWVKNSLINVSLPT